MQTKEEGGFTLVELLLVIVILGILAAIVVAAVGNTSTDAQQNACTADIKIVRSAIERAVASGAVVKADVDDVADLTPTYLADAPGGCSGGLAITAGVVTGTP